MWERHSRCRRQSPNHSHSKVQPMAAKRLSRLLIAAKNHQPPALSIGRTCEKQDIVRHVGFLSRPVCVSCKIYSVSLLFYHILSFNLSRISRCLAGYLRVSRDMIMAKMNRLSTIVWAMWVLYTVSSWKSLPAVFRTLSRASNKFFGDKWHVVCWLA